MKHVTFVVHPWEAGGPELTTEPILRDLNSTVRPSFPSLLFAFLSWMVFLCEILEGHISGVSVIPLMCQTLSKCHDI